MLMSCSWTSWSWQAAKHQKMHCDWSWFYRIPSFSLKILQPLDIWESQNKQKINCNPTLKKDLMDQITKQLANHTRMSYDSTSFKAYVHRDRPQKPTLESLYICCSDNLCIFSQINWIYSIHTGNSALSRPQSPSVCCSSVSFASMLLSKASKKQRFPATLSELKDTEITEVCNLCFIPFNT